MASRAATGIRLCRLRAGTGRGAARPDDAARASNQRMAIEDGMPLVWWSRLAGFPRARRIGGSDSLLDEACRPAATPPLLLWGQPVRDTTADQSITGASSWPLRSWPSFTPPLRPQSPAEDAADIAAINEAEPDFVWVGLGMPKQENGWSSISARSRRQRSSAPSALPFHFTWARNHGFRFGCSKRGWNGCSATDRAAPVCSPSLPARQLAFHRPHVAAGDWAEEIFAGCVTADINTMRTPITGSHWATKYLVTPS